MGKRAKRKLISKGIMLDRELKAWVEKTGRAFNCSDSIVIRAAIRHFYTSWEHQQVTGIRAEVERS